MANVYLYDGGSNTSPYDDWTKAATTSPQVSSGRPTTATSPTRRLWSLPLVRWVWRRY